MPNNAVLVIVGDVETDATSCGGSSITSEEFAAGPRLERQRTVEPEQTGERRVTIRKEGTTAYLKVAYHAPAIADPLFFPLLVARRRADRREGTQPVVQFPRPAAAAKRAALSRAGRARPGIQCLGRAASDRATVSLLSVGDGHHRHVARHRSKRRSSRSSTRVRQPGITPAELERAKAQLKARFIFDNDSISSIAHQIGYFETIAERGCVHRARGARRRRDARDCGEAARLLTVRRIEPSGAFEPRARALMERNRR